LDQRRTQRYKLQLPLHIVQLGDMPVNRVEKTRDISSGGVCFLSPTGVDIGGKIEYLITLSGSNPPVLRSQKPASDSPYEVAVTMERYQFVRPDEAIPATA